MRMLSKKEWNTIFSKTPRVCVDIVIKDKRGVLLIKRSIEPEKSKWHLPGGTILYKERIMHAVKRKVREETGLQIKIKKFLGVFEFMRWKEPGYSHIIDLIFLAEPVGGKLRGHKIWGKELKFFKKLPENMIREHRRILEGELVK